MVNNVYTGFWINWEDGRFAGATLTLPTYEGLILVSFLTLFVQFSGACFWRVICFIIHQFRSHTSPRDGLYHQQQTILRNAITAPNALWKLSRSALAWRGKVRAPVQHSLPLMIGTFVHIAFFATAGLFSSYIASTGAGEALVRGAGCGFPKELADVRNTDASKLSEQDLLTFNAEVLLGRLTLTKAAGYVRSCYNDDNNRGSTDCNTYVRPYLLGLNASAVTNATCPFGNDACKTAAVRYDSGYIHSNTDLGMNFPSSEEMAVRRVTTCAPIKGERYATDWVPNLPEAYGGKTNTSVKFYELGKGDNGCFATARSKNTNLTTFCISQYMKDYLQDSYTVNSNTAYWENSTASDFEPISDFNVTSADTTLLSIFSRTNYIGNNTDPLFNAHNASMISPDFSTPTYDLSILGCTEQYQFCNLATTECTALTGLYGVKHALDRGDLGLSARQNATSVIMWKAAWTMALQWAIEILRDRVLLVQDWVFTEKSLTSAGLPSNQWQMESHNLHNLSLAVMQRRINEYASPENFEIRPKTSSLDQLDTPTDPLLLDLCQQQKIRSGQHYSVSVLGMSVILGVGSVLILLDWVIIQQIFWFRSFTHLRLAKIADWKSTGTLQLHRQALEARSVGPWETNENYEFPVLMERDKSFVGLGIKDGPLLSQSHLEDTSYHGSRYTPLSGDTGTERELQVLDGKGRYKT